MSLTGQAHSERAFSCGGGVQSTACLVLAVQGKIPHKTFIFANVGDKAESPHTIKYVKDILIPYAKANNIEWVTTQWKWTRDPERSPDMYDEIMREGRKSFDIPLVAGGGGYMGNRGCTSKWKRQTVERELKRRGWTKEKPGILGKGISMDEPHRATPAREGDCWINDYPLIELGIDRSMCQSIIEKAGLPPAPKSSCWFCPYHTTTQWSQMKRDEPELFAKAVELENHVNAVRASVGKDKAYISAVGGKKNLGLAEAIPDQLDLFPEWIDEQDGCESGYCMT